jgi:hypothetical protein
MRQDAKAANAIADFKEQVKGVFTELDRDPILNWIAIQSRYGRVTL